MSNKKIQLKDKDGNNLYPTIVKQCILDIVYPIGSIYMSVKSTNPQTLFGGTWIQICQGRLLAGVGSTTDADGNSINMLNGETGGSKSHHHSTGNHTLTINEIPSHAHSIMNYNSGGSASGYNYVPNVGGGNKGYYNMGTATNGGGQAHNHGNTGTHMGWPPYFAVYMWKRTA